MILALAAVMLLSLVHIYGVRLTFSSAIPRSHWLSIAGGTSVAYVFVHILPELAHGQEAVQESANRILRYIEEHVYLVAMLGLLAFYGLERAVKLHADEENLGERSTDHHIFWVHVSAFSLYNAIIGYLLVSRYTDGTTELVIFTVAMVLHFLVNDHALRERHREAYRDIGRWMLAGSVFVGWLLGTLYSLSEAMTAVLFAFIAGALILNVLKEELPRERQSKFWAFALGALGYSVLMLVIT